MLPAELKTMSGEALVLLFFLMAAAVALFIVFRGLVLWYFKIIRLMVANTAESLLGGCASPRGSDWWTVTTAKKCLPPAPPRHAPRAPPAT